MATDSGMEETWSDWDGGNRNIAAGTILASAVAAGMVAYLIRRRRQSEERTLAGISSRAAEAARSALEDDRVAAGREFLTDKILPEFKPTLLALMRELEDVTNQAFRRAERTIKQL